jgi:hypothetical protein
MEIDSNTTQSKRLPNPGNESLTEIRIQQHDDFEIERNDNKEQLQTERIVPIFTSDRMKRKEQIEIDSKTKQPKRLPNPGNESLIEIRLQQNDEFEIERNDNQEQL